MCVDVPIGRRIGSAPEYGERGEAYRGEGAPGRRMGSAGSDCASLVPLGSGSARERRIGVLVCSCWCSCSGALPGSAREAYGEREHQEGMSTSGSARERSGSTRERARLHPW
jgi:hypothetical protein